jgi:hypothetical protein
MDEISACAVSSTTKSLRGDLSRAPLGSGGGLKCYSRPKLGMAGQVCVPTAVGDTASLATYSRNGVFVSDSYNRAVVGAEYRIHA